MALSYDDFLSNVLLFTTQTQRLALRAQGFASYSSLSALNVSQVSTLCQAIRRPGGQLRQGNRNINNPGQQVGMLSESRLTLAVYAAGLYSSINRVPQGENMTMSHLEYLRLHKSAIDSYTIPAALPELSKSFSIMKALESFELHLREHQGTTHVPLSYIIRKNVAPAALEDTQALLPFAESYNDLNAELIACTPHTGPTYATDNAMVLKLLQQLVQTSSHVSSLKPFQSRRDGRGAYNALRKHNFGNSKWDKLIEDAEAAVTSRIWDGKNHRFPLKLHIRNHRDAHNDFANAAQHVNYNPPNEKTRVSRLLKSITCNDTAVISAITTVRADPTKEDDFEEAADFLLKCAPEKKQQRHVHQISALSHNNHNNNNNDSGNRNGKVQVGQTGVEFRYYKKRDFDNLNQDQKTELMSQRQGKRGPNYNKNKKRREEGKEKRRIMAVKFAELEQQVALSHQTIAAMQQQPHGGIQQQAPLPPVPPTNPILPPIGFAQRPRGLGPLQGTRIDANGNRY